MVTVQLIHWNAKEAEEFATRFDQALYNVRFDVPKGPSFFKALQKQPPDVIVIELARLPSQGRDVGLTLRKTAATRHIPLIFVGGAPQKVQAIHSLLPDAIYTSWKALPGALQESLENPPTDPVVPESVFAAYRGRPLSQKLGIKEDTRVVVKNAPSGFERMLGTLPEGAVLSTGFSAGTDLIIWFTKTGKELKQGIREMAERVGQGALWIAWPKKTSGMSTGLTQQTVRETGLAAGLVDYKICSIDTTWSGLLFTRRKPKPETG